MINDMTSTSQYKDLNEFLAKHSAKNTPGTCATHTRIPDKALNIYGGSYIIPKQEESLFYFQNPHLSLVYKNPLSYSSY